jgi:ATP-dependent Clp protease ATP-binding subunit ClpA
VFERFGEQARLVVVYAQEEARALGHRHIGAEHLLLGVVGVEEAILPARLEDIRARIGTGPGTWSGQIPFTGGAKRTLERALREAQALGHTEIAPAHLLLAMADEPEAVLAAGATSDRIRVAAMRRLEHPQPSSPTRAPPPAPPGDPRERARAYLDSTIAAGGPVPVALGRELIGDLGNPVVDATLLLAMLAKDGRSAELLRQRGLDEGAVSDWLGP